jgi:MFS family permease
VVVQRILPVEPARVARAAGATSICAAAALLVIALSPNLAVAVGGRIAFSTLVAALIPGIYVLGSMVLPARARALGFSAAGIFGLPGVLALPLAGRLGDLYGLRTGMFVLIPIYLVGSVLIASASRFVAADIHNNRTATLANARAQRAEDTEAAEVAEVADEPG